MIFKDFYYSAVRDGSIGILGRIFITLLIAAQLFICFTTFGDETVLSISLHPYTLGSMDFWDYVLSGMFAMIIKALIYGTLYLVILGMYALYCWISGHEFEFSDYAEMYDFIIMTIFGSFPEKRRILHPNKYAKDILAN